MIPFCFMERRNLTYLQAILQDGPAEYFRLNDSPAVNGSAIKNYSGANFDGKLTVAFTTLSPLQPSLILDSSANSLLCSPTGTAVCGATILGHALTNTARSSVEVWYKPTAFGTGTNRKIAQANNLIIGVLSTGQIFTQSFEASSGTTRVLHSIAVMNIGNIYHLVATQDGTNLNLYVNGSLDSSLACGDENVTSSAAFGINGLSNSLTTQGYFQEYAYYPYVLSSTQILTHYNKGING